MEIAVNQSILRHERDAGIEITRQDLSDSKIMTTHGQSHGPFELWGALAYNQPSVTMANNGAPLTGFEEDISLEEDPEMGACLTQKITFKF